VWESSPPEVTTIAHTKATGILEPHPATPAGTKVSCTAHFDNSVQNPFNPNPEATVRWGEQTYEEMMIGFVDYYFEK
jgi:hypothetical protein